MRWFMCTMAAVVILCGCSGQTPPPLNGAANNTPEDAKRDKKPEAEKPDKEAAAVKLVEQLGGWIKRDDKQPGNPVVEVQLVRTQVTDADVKELKELKQLNSLDLSLTEVTDAGVKELKEALPKCHIVRD